LEVRTRITAQPPIDLQFLVNGCLNRIIPLLLVIVVGPMLAASTNMSEWRTYRAVIPHFYLEYKIPPDLIAGYRGQEGRVVFEHPEKDDSAFAFGEAAYQKNIATFYCGVVGDFSSWDLTVDIFVVNFDRNKKLVRSTNELAEYVKRALSKKKVLEGGKEVSNLGEVSREDIGATEIVVATAADLYHVTPLRLKGGGRTTFMPFQIYFIRLDNEVTVGVRVFHFNEGRLSATWHDKTKAMAMNLIENLKFTVQPAKEP